MIVSFDQNDATYNAFKDQIITNNVKKKKDNIDDGVKPKTTMVLDLGVAVEKSPLSWKDSVIDNSGNAKIEEFPPVYMNNDGNRVIINWVRYTLDKGSLHKILPKRLCVPAYGVGRR